MEQKCKALGLTVTLVSYDGSVYTDSGEFLLYGSGKEMKKKSVLITGASRGIGQACAESFARAGYQVFINCRSSVEKLEKLAAQLRKEGYTCDTVIGDVGVPQEVEKIFQVIEKKCGGIDVLVNNAGISYVGLLTDMSNEEWEKLLQTNLSSAFYCCRSAIPHMVSKKRGKIINISSMWGRVGASCEVAYSATKAGINGFTMALAKELAPSNIQVNAIACGVIDTEMNACFNEEEKRALAEEIPAGRFGTVQETAKLVLDLAENHAYLTGQIIGFDGGFI